MHRPHTSISIPILPATEVKSFDEFSEAVKKPCACSHAKGSGSVLGYAALDDSGHLEPFRFDRRPVGPTDISFEVTHCGICHSDLHQIKNEWKNSIFPMVPGHEIVGICTEVGAQVTKFKPGDRVAVGCMVDSCGECEACQRGLEQYCSVGVQWTYNTTAPDGTINQGGYSTSLVVKESFALRFPDNLPLDAGAPLLCAGITTYSPLRHWGLDKPGKRVGVIGLGGLGHMAVKLAKAFGAEVTVFSTSPGKEREALHEFGADHFIVSKDRAAMKKAHSTLDGIIDTVSANHPLADYLATLKLDGSLIMVGLPENPLALPAFAITAQRRSVAGSAIGGIQETQEMLDFCGEHNVTCMIEKVDVADVNKAMERLAANDVKYRCVNGFVLMQGIEGGVG